ncbi:MAG: hypothetical protein MZV70_74490 [Desulfobacterales bacterium]|nr:hypothetical protein [Desulfobacterales bacterium]
MGHGPLSHATEAALAPLSRNGAREHHRAAEERRAEGGSGRVTA